MLSHNRKTIIVFCIDVDAYFELLSQGYLVGFKMPEIIRGGN